MAYPNDYIANCIKRRWSFAEGTLKHVAAFKEKTTMIDVGANIGAVTLFAAARGHKVFSVEATEFTAQAVQQSIALNGFINVTFFKMGASDQQECLGLNSDWYKVNGNHNHKANTFGTHRGITGNKKEWVTMDRLDAVLSDVGPVSLMKLDVEGFECRALKGAKKLFEKRLIQSVVIEVNPEALLGAECSCEELHDILDGLCVDTASYPRCSGMPDFVDVLKQNCEVTL